MSPIWSRRPKSSRTHHKSRHGTPTAGEVRKLKGQVQHLKERLAGSKKFQHLKEKHMALLVDAIEVSQTPIKLEVNYKSTDALLSFLEKISDLALQKQINERLLGALNGSVAQAIRILQPPQPMSVTVTQQVAGVDYSKLVESLPEDEQVVLAKAIDKLEHTQTQPGPS